MPRLCVLLVGVFAAVLPLVPGVAAPVPKVKAKGWTEEGVRAKLFATCWYEADRTIAGTPEKELKLSSFGWKFGDDGAECWELGGELSTGGHGNEIRTDVAADPWRMDILNWGEKGRVSVLPGIIRFDGDDVLWVTEYPGDGWYSALNPKGEYKGRPTGFESTAKNRWAVYRLKACKYLQTQFP